MEWSELYNSENQPSDADIEKFIDNSLWQEMNAYLQETYSIQPKKTFSKCSMDKGAWKGWNVKYQKSGKALCTLYPKQGFFIAMVVMGAKEVPEAELLMPFCTEYTQKLYKDAPFCMGGKWLAMFVTDADVLNDVKNLTALRVPPK